MKTFACVLLLAAAAVAEPPRYRQARFNSAGQEDRQQDMQQTGYAPYPAAGFRPAVAFNLPTREELSPPSTLYGVPDTSYGAPLNTYAAPQSEYGPPDSESKSKDDEEKDVENLESGKKDENADKKQKLEEEPKNDAEDVSAQGAYYVLLPNSQLQRVMFQTENDIRNMAYTARLQYKNEDRAPIYVYTAVPQYQSAAYVQLF